MVFFFFLKEHFRDKTSFLYCLRQGLASVPWRPFAKYTCQYSLALMFTLGPLWGSLVGATEHLRCSQSCWPAPVTFLTWPSGSPCRCLSLAHQPPAAQPIAATAPWPMYPASPCSLVAQGRALYFQPGLQQCSLTHWSRPCVSSQTLLATLRVGHILLVLIDGLIKLTVETYYSLVDQGWDLFCDAGHDIFKIFMKSSLLILSFMDSAFGVVSGKSSLITHIKLSGRVWHTCSWSLRFMLISRSFIVLHCTLGSFIHLKFLWRV